MSTKYVYPPGPSDWLPFRLLFRFLRDPAAFLIETARAYPDIASVRERGGRYVLVTHPDLIQDILVTHNHNFLKADTSLKRVFGNGLLGSDGDFHLRQRRALQPLFLRDKVAHHTDAIVALTERFGSGWDDGVTLDIYEQMLKVTQVIVGKTLFDTDVESETAKVRESLTEAAKAAYFFLRVPFGAYLEKLPLSRVRRFHQARARLHGLMQELIDEHRRVGKDRGDILSLMLRLREEHGAQDIFTDEMLRSQALTLFVAGHETTATALTWTWYLLGRNPEAEKRLHEELDRVLGDRLPTHDDIPHLTYTEMVFAESMRIFSPIYLMARKNVADHPLGKYLFPPGTNFLISPYVTHHDPRWFPDPERFDPERLTREARSKLPKFAYFPFGGGPRQCIGESFAWLEGVLMIATLARKWRLKAVSDKPVEAIELVTMQPKGGLPMRLERRRPG